MIRDFLSCTSVRQHRFIITMFVVCNIFIIAMRTSPFDSLVKRLSERSLGSLSDMSLSVCLSGYWSVSVYLSLPVYVYACVWHCNV